MTKRLHVKLSPSKAHRWLPCPGSLAFDIEGPESQWAEDGAHAHAILEAILKGQMVLAGDVIGGKPATVERIQQAIEVRDFLRQWKSTHPDWAVESETPIEVGHWGWGLEKGVIAGTADAVMWSPQELVVLDAKFGFVRVEPQDNPQLHLYAIGALGELLQIGFEPKLVTLVIAQPDYEGLMQFREHRMDFTDLARWAASKWDNVRAAIDGSPILNAEDERACRYCPGRANCTTRLEHLVKLAQDDWRESHTLEELIPLVTKVRHICTDLEREAARRIREGQTVKGYKLVESRSIRKWAPDMQLSHIIDALRARRPEIMGGEVQAEPKLLSPAQLEKKFKADGKAVTAKYAITPRGGPKLVPESDPRPHLSLDDFKQEDVDADLLEE